MENKSYMKFANKNYSSWYERIMGMSLLMLISYKKLPFLQYNGQINPDESQMLTQAITLEYDPVFWSSVDGTTSGPINSFLILLIKYIGFPFNYTTLHIAALGFICICLFMTYNTVRMFFNYKVAYLSLLIIYSFFFFTNHKDFNHFASELPSVTLMTIAIYLLTLIYTSDKSLSWTYYLLAVLCCLIPLAKLQGGPIAFLYLFYSIICLVKHNKLFGCKISLIIALGSGLLTVIGSLLFYLYVNDLLTDFFVMYIRTNLNHYNSADTVKMFIKLMFKSSYDYLFFLLINTLIWLIGARLILKYKLKYTIDLNVLRFLILNIVVSIGVIARTGYVFEHYLLYSLFPIILLTAYFLNIILYSNKSEFYQKLNSKLIMIGLCFSLIITCLLKMDKENQNFNTLRPPLCNKNIVNLIKKYTKSTDCLVVWGWNLTYHVFTGLRQGTRQNHSIRCMITNSLGAIHDPQLIAYYRHQFVHDMERNRPAVFIDEVKANDFFINPNEVVHQTVPELDRFISCNYKLVSSQSGVQVYIRNDRLKWLSHYSTQKF
ncbi:hypothetical protein ACO2Q8_00680 [Larkinella sp. VNQ87]|uniref:hypothetical protein n=1 Tax=Larkinella sp. VNQ87 TaxID=3400921 RepID=UPI003C0B1972